MGKKRKAGGHTERNGGTDHHIAERRETTTWPTESTTTSNEARDKLKMYSRNGREEDRQFVTNPQSASYGSRPSHNSPHYASDDRRHYRRSQSPSRMDYRYDSRGERSEYGADRRGWRPSESHHSAERPVHDTYYREDAYARREESYYRDSASSSRAPQSYESSYWPPPETSRYPADDRREWRAREQASYPPAYDTWERDERYSQSRPADDRYAQYDTRADPYAYSRPADDRYHPAQAASSWPSRSRDDTYDDRYSRSIPESTAPSWPNRERQRDDGYPDRSRAGQWDRRDDRRVADESSWEPAPGWKERGANTDRRDALPPKKKKKNKNKRDRNKERRREVEETVRARDRDDESDRGRPQEGRKNGKTKNGSRWSDEERDYQSRKRRKSVSRSRSPEVSPGSPPPKRPRLSPPTHEPPVQERTLPEDRIRIDPRSPSPEKSKPASKRKRTPSSSRSPTRSPSITPSPVSPKPRSPKPLHRLNGALPVKITRPFVRPPPTGPKQAQAAALLVGDASIPKGPRAGLANNGAPQTSANNAIRRFFPGTDEDNELAPPTGPRSQSSREPPRGPRGDNGYARTAPAQDSESRPGGEEEERLTKGGWATIRPGIKNSTVTNGATRSPHDDEKRLPDMAPEQPTTTYRDERQDMERRSVEAQKSPIEARRSDTRDDSDGWRRSPRDYDEPRYRSRSRSPARTRTPEYEDRYSDRYDDRYDDRTRDRREYRDRDEREYYGYDDRRSHGYRSPQPSRYSREEEERAYDDNRDERSVSVPRSPVPPQRPAPEERISRRNARIGQRRSRDLAISYEIGNAVGEGTFGKVYKATDPGTGVSVALKRIRMEGEKDGFPVTAMREIKILQALRHQNVVRLYEMMVSKGSVYMVFEYMEHDLMGVLSQSLFRFTDGNLKSLAKQMLDGLAYLHHRGILHRDLKCSNILVNKHGELKLADFGLARFYNKRRRLDYTNRVITLWYRPPELLLGATEYQGEVDVWSAGCIIVELFTRAAPFRGETEIDQIQSIFRIKGTPDAEDWPEVTELPWFEMVRPKQKLPDRFEEMMRETLGMPGLIDLLQQMLIYNPLKRITAAEALDHPFFTSISPAPQRPTQMEDVRGEWHELETKPLRDMARQEEKRRRAVAAAAAAQEEAGNVSA